MRESEKKKPRYVNSEAQKTFMRREGKRTGRLCAKGGLCHLGLRSCLLGSGLLLLPLHALQWVMHLLFRKTHYFSTRSLTRLR
jgi:hypothetical protein